MNKILAIIVTFNRKDLLRECLDNLLKQNYSSFDILVVDNCSTDGTKDLIDEYIHEKRVMYNNTGKNIGGAGGFSTGIKIGVNKEYEYLWVMDDDTIVQDNALDAFMDTIKLLDNDFGFLCSDVRWIDGNPCAMNIPNVDGKWYCKSEFLEEGLLAVQQCSFVSCFFKTEIVKKIGLPIKEFFIWGDDAEYTKRISTRYPSYFVSKSRVIHKMGSNIPTDISQDSADRLFRYQFSYRNMYYVNKMQGNKLSMLMYYYGVFLDFKHIIKSKEKGRRKKIRVMFKSVRAGKKFHPEIEFPN